MYKKKNFDEVIIVTKFFILTGLVLLVFTGILSANYEYDDTDYLKKIIKNAEHDARIDRERRYLGIAGQGKFYSDYIYEMKELNSSLKTLIDIMKNK